MSTFDLAPERPLYHGGSFNGNPLGMVAGAIALRDLTAKDIARIDAQADTLRAEIAAAAATCGLPVRTSGVGSAFGLYVLDGEDGEIDWKRSSLLHLAAVNRGVYFGVGGEFGLSTALSDLDVAQAIASIRGALADVAAEVLDRV
jgi:glutamate-1-semialdehyde 2,1-aminomutase